MLGDSKKTRAGYNYYWMFVVNLALCDAYERAVHRPRHSADPSGRGLVLSAAGLEVLVVISNMASKTALSVLWLGSLAAPVFWFFYMRHIETLRDELRDPKA